MRCKYWISSRISTVAFTSTLIGIAYNTYYDGNNNNNNMLVHNWLGSRRKRVERLTHTHTHTLVCHVIDEYRLLPPHLPPYPAPIWLCVCVSLKWRTRTHTQVKQRLWGAAIQHFGHISRPTWNLFINYYFAVDIWLAEAGHIRAV